MAVVPLYRNPILSVKRGKSWPVKKKKKKKKSRRDGGGSADSFARARLFMFINVPYVRVYRFAISLSFLSRDNDTDLRQLSRNRGFKWT